MKTRRTWTDERLIEICNDTTIKSKAGILRALGLSPKGGSYKIIDYHIDRLDLDVSHLTGQSHLRGKTHNWGKSRPLSNILRENVYYSSSKLRERLIENDTFERRCYKCNLSEWNDNPISLELEHINGVNTDNRIENLTLLCPNCHAQTSTYRGKNQKRSKKDF